ncbi:BQ5605_C002g01109 [Microbotryum silenes-dioicae]|uniref:BQ5605_C002g01109 protein n=1 Tax=Microbotryum silenes-dioicae TaxID=796604 RepID=A0A2X0P158_9BASI|nr:BQ5605_C002g01109 [Microbotryum silenes-dioicae]
MDTGLASHWASSAWPHLLPTALTVILFQAISFLLFTLWSYFRRYNNFSRLPCPPTHSFLLGNLDQISSSPPGVPQKHWSRQYGGLFKFRGFLGEQRLCITDPVALSYILVQNGYRFVKPGEVRGNLARNLGSGLLFAEGDDHKRQKRIMIPAFAPSALRNLVPTFFELSYTLKDRWVALIETSDSDEKAFASNEKMEEWNKTHEEGMVVLDVLKWLSKLTLDTIGVAGFGYDCGALSGTPSELASAFQSILTGGGSIPKKVPISQLLLTRLTGHFATLFPNINLSKLVPNKRVQLIRIFTETMERVSRKIIEEKREELRAGGGGTEMSIGGGKDLITLLLKSNSGEAKSRMSDVELRGQIATFLFAGNETTSTTLSWLLHYLSLHPSIQVRTRQEIRHARANAFQEHGREELNAEDLNGLTYLDAVVREVLRLEPPVALSTLQASEDDVIPLGVPIRGIDGKFMNSVDFKKKQILAIPISAVNTNTLIFGDDADKFVPERWLVKEAEKGAISGNVGVFSNLMTFMAGPRACIGYRFAVLEIKVIATVLLDHFEFLPRDSAQEMIDKLSRRSLIVTRPLVIDEEHLGHRLPLRVRLADRDVDFGRSFPSVEFEATDRSSEVMHE